MTLSRLEAGLKSRARAAFSLEEGAMAGFHLASPPPHISADVSIAWPIAAAKLLKKSPLKIAEELAAALAPEEAQVVPPGFVNLKFRDSFLFEAVKELDNPCCFAQPEFKGEKINLEFVSANPTGPMHLASGRGATLGDSLARIFRALGAEVSTEFYVNNVGRQVELLGRSLKARYEGQEPPEGGYQGVYLKEIAAALPKAAAEGPDKQFSEYAVAEMLKLRTGATLHHVPYKGSTPAITDMMGERVDFAFFGRLNRAVQRDAGINALVALHSRSMLASMSIKPEMENIRAWFSQTPSGDRGDITP